MSQHASRVPGGSQGPRSRVRPASPGGISGPPAGSTSAGRAASGSWLADLLKRVATAGILIPVAVALIFFRRVGGLHRRRADAADRAGGAAVDVRQSWHGIRHCS